MRKHLILVLLASVTSFGIRAQEGVASTDPSTAKQAGNPSLTLTADGVRACSDRLKFKSVLPDGVYRVEGSVLPPKPKNTPKASLSDEARQYIKRRHVANFEATSVVGLTIDANGKPQDLCILKEAGLGLDRKAFESAALYRFEPATLNGKPVPVRIAVQVNFRHF